jgi:murein DD-endopeptidase MepM/ murein hydrolase activator NlpD
MPTSVAVTSVAGAARQVAKQFSHLPNLGDYFKLPTFGFNWGRIHGRNGVDIANSCGTPIYAAADGAVTVADPEGWNGGFGKYIKISHPNGTETLYAHASKLLVFPGQNISRGDKIMLMGTTGRSTGCHLHFEVHGARNPLAKN